MMFIVVISALQLTAINSLEFKDCGKFLEFLIFLKIIEFFSHAAFDSSILIFIEAQENRYHLSFVSESLVNLFVCFFSRNGNKFYK